MKIAIITDTHFGARNDNVNFNEYVSTLSGQNKERELVQEEISEEDLDSLPISNTKH